LWMHVLNQIVIYVHQRQLLAEQLVIQDILF
jgi:hypothetical protein